MADASRARLNWPPGAAGDAALAAAVGVFVVLTTVVEWSGELGLRAVPALGWALIVVGSAALAWRRRHPVAVAVIALAVTMAYYPLVSPDGALLVTLIIALYTLASAGMLVAAAVIGVVAVVGSVYGEYGSDESPLGDAGFFLLISWLVAAVAIGAVAHGRELSREEALRRHATEERLRIARELHDVLGHHVSLINVQAGAALHRLQRDAAASARENGAAEALAAIKEASRDALRELRGTLGVLRQADEPAPTAPSPGLSRLPELIARARNAGLAVRLETRGEPAPAPPAVDLAAYRIVQEALTNVTRHAQASSVVVTVTVGGHDVTVEVADDGRGGPVKAGSGIEGMRERAEAVDGSFDVRDRPGGGLVVTARLPCQPRGRRS